jgi:hypothetical protein
MPSACPLSIRHPRGGRRKGKSCPNNNWFRIDSQTSVIQTRRASREGAGSRRRLSRTRGYSCALPILEASQLVEIGDNCSLPRPKSLALDDQKTMAIVADMMFRTAATWDALRSSFWT